MKVQLHEIAKECGVSSMTVSRALDPFKNHLVSEKKRTEILKCCEKHGYAPNSSASSLATGRSSSVGLIHPRGALGSGSRTYGKMISCLSNELQKYNYFLSLLPIESGDQKSIDKEVVKAFRSGRVDGYISLTGYIGEEALKEMAERRFPIVTFNMPSGGFQLLSRNL